MTLHQRYNVQISGIQYCILEPAKDLEYFINEYSRKKYNIEFTIRLSSSDDRTNPEFLRSQCMKYLTLLGYSETYEIPEELSVYNWNYRYDPEKNKVHNCFIGDFFMIGKKEFYQLKRKLASEDNLLEHLKEHFTYWCFEIFLTKKKKTDK